MGPPADPMPLAVEDDVVRVRSAVRQLADRLGLDGFSSVAVSTAASELARNAVVHGGGGEATLEELDESGRRGLRVTFRDTGPGIADVARALKGGFSTRGSFGLGLSGAKRLVDEFALESRPGFGTRVVIAKWSRAR